MKMVFKNIDKSYFKSRHEPKGEVQPKYWFMNSYGKRVLIKRQHRERVNGQKAKSKTFNHYGEYFAYLLGEKAGLNMCPVELITLHDTKNKYGKTMHLYTACSSENVRFDDETIMPGETVIERFMFSHQKEADSILSYSYFIPTDDDHNMTTAAEDNVDIVLQSIKAETQRYEKASGLSQEQINHDVQNNIQDAIDMIVFDNIFGNSDRHSENWSVGYSNSGTMRIYPMYDNEAILGFRRPEATIKKIVDLGYASDLAPKISYSRMGVSPINSGVSYRTMLTHLATEYPEETLKSMKKITDRVTLKDVEAMYDSVPGIVFRSQDMNELSMADELPKEYRTYGVTLYKERSKFAKNLIKKLEDKEHLGDEIAL